MESNKTLKILTPISRASMKPKLLSQQTAPLIQKIALLSHNCHACQFKNQLLVDIFYFPENHSF
eukprot:c37657_g1_i1 orf=684-875(-)